MQYFWAVDDALAQPNNQLAGVLSYKLEFMCKINAYKCFQLLLLHQRQTNKNKFIFILTNNSTLDIETLNMIFLVEMKNSNRRLRKYLIKSTRTHANYIKSHMHTHKHTYKYTYFWDNVCVLLIIQNMFMFYSATA